MAGLVLLTLTRVVAAIAAAHIVNVQQPEWAVLDSLILGIIRGQTRILLEPNTLFVFIFCLTLQRGTLVLIINKFRLLVGIF